MMPGSLQDYVLEASPSPPVDSARARTSRKRKRSTKAEETAELMNWWDYADAEEGRAAETGDRADSSGNAMHEEPADPAPRRMSEPRAELDFSMSPHAQPLLSREAAQELLCQLATTAALDARARACPSATHSSSSDCDDAAVISHGEAEGPAAGTQGQEQAAHAEAGQADSRSQPLSSQPEREEHAPVTDCTVESAAMDAGILEGLLCGLAGLEHLFRQAGKAPEQHSLEVPANAQKVQQPITERNPAAWTSDDGSASDTGVPSTAEGSAPCSQPPPQPCQPTVASRADSKYSVDAAERANTPTPPLTAPALGHLDRSRVPGCESADPKPAVAAAPAQKAPLETKLSIESNVSAWTVGATSEKHAEGVCTKYKGVRPTKSIKRRRFKARIKTEGKYRDLGLYDTPEEAARAWDRAAVELGRPPGALNFPPPGVPLYGKRPGVEFTPVPMLFSTPSHPTAVLLAHLERFDAADKSAVRHMLLALGLESSIQQDPSRYCGLRYGGGAWQARTKEHGQNYKVGAFTSPEAAAVAWDIAAEARGRSKQNFKVHWSLSEATSKYMALVADRLLAQVGLHAARVQMLTQVLQQQ